MSAVHYGDGGEVKALASRLKENLSDIRDLSKRGEKLLGVMQSSVKDNAYQEAETIVRKVELNLLAGMDDAIEVCRKLQKYGEYLESLC